MYKEIINKPVRIAHVIGKLMTGGVESVVFNYYRAIDKTKVQFDFFSMMKIQMLNLHLIWSVWELDFIKSHHTKNYSAI